MFCEYFKVVKFWKIKLLTTTQAYTCSDPSGVTKILIVPLPEWGRWYDCIHGSQPTEKRCQWLSGTSWFMVWCNHQSVVGYQYMVGTSGPSQWHILETYGYLLMGRWYIPTDLVVHTWPSPAPTTSQSGCDGSTGIFNGGLSDRHTKK